MHVSFPRGDTYLSRSRNRSPPDPVLSYHILIPQRLRFQNPDLTQDAHLEPRLEDLCTLDSWTKCWNSGDVWRGIDMGRDVTDMSAVMFYGVGCDKTFFSTIWLWKIFVTLWTYRYEYSLRNVVCIVPSPKFYNEDFNLDSLCFIYTLYILTYFHKYMNIYSLVNNLGCYEKRKRTWNLSWT